MRWPVRPPRSWPTDMEAGKAERAHQPDLIRRHRAKGVVACGRAGSAASMNRRSRAGRRRRPCSARRAAARRAPTSPWLCGKPCSSSTGGPLPPTTQAISTSSTSTRLRLNSSNMSVSSAVDRSHARHARRDRRHPRTHPRDRAADPPLYTPHADAARRPGRFRPAARIRWHSSSNSSSTRARSSRAARSPTCCRGRCRRRAWWRPRAATTAPRSPTPRRRLGVTGHDLRARGVVAGEDRAHPRLRRRPGRDRRRATPTRSPRARRSRPRRARSPCTPTTSPRRCSARARVGAGARGRGARARHAAGGGRRRRADRRHRGVVPRRGAESSPSSRRRRRRSRARSPPAARSTRRPAASPPIRWRPGASAR